MTGSRGLQPLVCSMCGSVWFRLATFARSDEAHLQPPRLAMCLCGAAVPPLVSGVRSGIAQRELDGFLDALAVSRRRRLAVADLDAVPDASVGTMLASQLARLESACLLVQRRAFPALPIAKPPRPPRRVAATHGLD